MKLKHAIERLRQHLANGGSIALKSDAEKLVIGWLVSDMDRCLLGAPRKVINATGVLLHTGLGRAPLADAACRAVMDAAGACLLEVNPESGDRSYRGFQVDDLLKALTGEHILIVNNNAGATLLLLQGLCQGREVLILAPCGRPVNSTCTGAPWYSESTSSVNWKSLLQNDFGPCVSACSTTTDDICVVCETEGISIPAAADALTHMRPHVLELAGRLHSRHDVPW